MSDDVRDRARKIIEECEYQFSAMRQDARAAEVIAALDAAGIALVDAELLEQLHERCRELAETLGAERERYDRELERLRDEKRRLLALRKAWDDRFDGKGWFGVDAQNRIRAARAAVADIEPEMAVTTQDRREG